MAEGFFNKVYKLVKQIPEGKVVTYGQIAKALGTSDARRVGYALHANSSKKVPCHRVVDRTGRLAPNFSFGGANEQRRRLLEEGIKLKDEMHVDLTECIWRFERNPKHQI